MDKDEALLVARDKDNPSLLQRVEGLYLILLRSAVLLIATGLLLYGAWLCVSGLYSLSRSAASVEEAKSSVASDELVNAQMAVPIEVTKRGAVATPAQQKFYATSLNRYYALFRSRFEQYRQREDKTLSKDEFDDTFLQVPARLRGVADGEVNFAEDSADLKTFIDTITAAAENPQVVSRLSAYRAAKKIAVRTSVQKTRTEYRRGWNRFSTDCDGWFYEPVGCAEQRAVEVPYTIVETRLEFPKGTQSHIALFRALQDRYFTMIQERRQAARLAAETERDNIIEGNARGSEKLGRSVVIAGAFLALMFFFLLIAIERHQRGLVNRLNQLSAVRSQDS